MVKQQKPSTNPADVEAANEGGRPQHGPSDKDRGSVQALSAAGYSQEQIAEYLDIDEKTLRKHYRRELDFALNQIIAGAVSQLGRMALGAPAQFDAKGQMLRAEVKPDLGAICFLLKTKGKSLGWTERHEVTGKDGAPLGATPDLSKLSDDELAAYIALNKKLASGDGVGAGGTGDGASPSA